MANAENRFKTLQDIIDEKKLKQHIIPEGEEINYQDFGISDYFKHYGFEVSDIWSYFYEKANGNKSDRYVSVSLYYYYILPYLQNLNLSLAYVDKNFYGEYFKNVKQPETILKRTNGRLYHNHHIVSPEKALNIIKSHKNFIFKPSIESGSGMDIIVVKENLTPEYSNKLSTNVLSKIGGGDFIIQQLVEQSPVLNLLNPTSLNTVRIYTLFLPEETEPVVLGTFVRFGGKDALVDNASLGGGFCRINETGIIEDKIFQYKNYSGRSLQNEKGICNLAIPNFDNIIDLVKELHIRLPYLNLVGWDIGIDTENEPVLIEYNQYPDAEFIQMGQGPMFGDYLDSIMEKISQIKTSYPLVAKQKIPGLPYIHDYNFEIGRKILL